MKRTLFALSLALWAALAAAAPLTFSSATYSTGALAIAGAALNSNFDVSPSSTLPLLTSATATSDADSASSAGAADTGFLGASAEANSDVDNASSLASAEFLGLFTGTGAPIGLKLSYDAATTGSGTAESRLLVTFNALSLFDDVITGPGFFETTIDLAAGIDGVLDILLTSSADATGASAFNIASVAFTASVPEPSTLVLLLAGAAMLGTARRWSWRKAALAG